MSIFVLRNRYYAYMETKFLFLLMQYMKCEVSLISENNLDLVFDCFVSSGNQKVTVYMPSVQVVDYTLEL